MSVCHVPSVAHPVCTHCLTLNPDKHLVRERLCAHVETQTIQLVLGHTVPHGRVRTQI